MTGEQSGHSKTRSQKLVGLLAAIVVAFAGILGLTAIHHPGKMDYIEYWSSGKLLIHHLDPYSPADVLVLEKSQGFSQGNHYPLVTPNPPWTLFLLIPLGLTGAYEGLFLWLVATIACILGSILLLNKEAKNGPLALIFAPVFACICSGQSSPFLLLGFALFLYFQRDRPFIAGASLLLMAIKPHLFLVFWAVLLVDCIYRRRLLILAGGASALAVASVFAMCFDPRIWQHYLATMHGYNYGQAFIPTGSMLFRMLINIRAFWLLFVPSAVGVAWGLWYYFRRRQIWDWRIHGMLLMLVSVFVSPYGLFTDEIVLLPSIVFAMTLPDKRKYSGWILLAINTAALGVVASGAQLASRDYIWTPAAWLLWFLYATNGFRRFGEREAPATETVQIAGLEGA